MKRKIIEINDDLCNGCGNCIPGCPEGALQMIDGKARLISDLFCDGLGACIGECPTGAIEVIEREAQAYSETKVMGNIIQKGPNTVKAHLRHLKEHGEMGYFNEAVDFLKKRGIEVPVLETEKHMYHACPSSLAKSIERHQQKPGKLEKSVKQESELANWPVQIHLANPNAPYFKGADLLVAADCVPFAYANFHGEMLAGKTVVIGCPKLDDVTAYQEKLAAIIGNNDVKTVTVARMEVPCCGGLSYAVKNAIKESGRSDVELIEKVISIKGEVLK